MRSIGTLALPSPEPFAAHPRVAAHCTAAIVSARAGTDRDDIRALGIESLEDLAGDAP
ncbi:hypothetical protein [Marichromatium sp. AB32]|uniref:hypothetical protein n=1 Tax=Marichromatium sp. AB32 TaxID=2483363 RepID=UPI001681A280|nr:hypothetical protein [Marichromatium sp. AB32]